MNCSPENDRIRLDDTVEIFSTRFPNITTASEVHPKLQTFNEAVGKLNIIQISASCEPWTLLLTASGDVYAHGVNSEGQMSQGDLEYHENNAVKVQGLDDHKIIQVSCGFEHALFLTSDGLVFGCGRNDYYQVGRGGGKITTAQQIPLDEKIRYIQAGRHSSHAISVTNQVYGWGDNEYGELGCGNLELKYDTPVKTILPTESPMKHFYFAKCGYHGLVVLENNQVYGWGYNKYGQLAIGNVQNQGSLQPIDLDRVTNNINHSTNVSTSELLEESGKVRLIDAQMTEETTVILTNREGLLISGRFRDQDNTEFTRVMIGDIPIKQIGIVSFAIVVLSQSGQLFASQFVKMAGYASRTVELFDEEDQSIDNNDSPLVFKRLSKKAVGSKQVDRFVLLENFDLYLITNGNSRAFTFPLLTNAYKDIGFQFK